MLMALVETIAMPILDYKKNYYMPIDFQDLSEHGNIYTAVFGFADIYISTANLTNGKKLLLFHNCPDDETKDQLDSFQGESINKMPTPDFAMQFNEPASIGVLMSALTFLQTQIFKDKGML